MAEKERPDEGPSLEMPSLGSLFKRRKKPAPEPRPDEPSAEDFDRLVRGESARSHGDDAPSSHEGTPVDERSAAGHVSPTAAADDAVAIDPDPEPSEPSGPSEPETLPEESPAEQTAVRGMPAVTDDPPAETEAVAAIDEDAPSEPELDAPAEPDVEQTAVREMPAITDEEPTEVLPEHDLIAESEEADLADLEEDEVVEEPTTVAATPAPDVRRGLLRRRTTATAGASASDPAPSRAPAEMSTGEPGSGDAAGQSDASPVVPEERRGLADFSLPPLAQPAAAAVTGAVVGLLAVALTYFGLRGCEAVKGTSSCGGPGIPILVAILVVLVIVGSVLLGAWKVTDPSSTSFLAVGLLAVIALLFLIEVIFSPAMVVVIPLVSIATYCLSQWVTTRFIEEED